MRVDQPHLGVLGRVQTQVQHQAVEGVHRPVQLVPGQCVRGRQDTLHARRAVARVEQSRPDQRDPAAHGCARPGAALRPAVGRPREGCRRVARKRPRDQLGIRT